MKTRSYCYAMAGNHRILLKQMILSVIFILFVAGCSKELKDESPDEKYSDKTVPSIVSVSPANNTNAVSTLTDLKVVFSEKIDSGTVNISSFTLRRGASVVNGSVSYEGNTATFVPALELEGNTVYTGTVKAGVKDLAGNETSSDYLWKFTTGEMIDTKAPTVISVSPVVNAINVPSNSIITATFNEDIKSESLTASTFLLKKGTSVITGTMSISGNTISFAPSTSLAASSVYSVTITREVKDAAGNPMIADYTWSFTTAAAADIAAPTISSVLPLANATGVQTSITPSVSFSEAVDPATINSSTFLLKKDGVNITGTVILNGTSATFTPATALIANTTYSATVTTGVKDIAGNSLAEPMNWTFTTTSAADVTAPAITSVLPLVDATNVQTGIKPSVTFSEAIDPATINSSTFLLKKDGVSIAGTVALNGSSATFTPANALIVNSTYTATVTTGVKDIAGNQLAAAKTWSFTTAGIADIIAPQVSSVAPQNNATSVQVSVKPSVTFSEAIDPATLNSNTFIIKQGSTAISGTISVSGNTATFSPANALSAGTAYTINVTTAIKDLAGNAMTSAFSSAFTTAVATPAGKSFATDVVPVLNTCNQCHRHNWTSSTDPSVFHSNLVSSGYINLTTPTNGRIYTKLNGGHPSSGVTAEQKATVLTWIKEGSKNN